MKILLFVFLFFSSMTGEVVPTNNLQGINISVEIENYDPCGCDADLQECIQNSPPGSGCIQEYVQCSIACGC